MNDHDGWHYYTWDTPHHQVVTFDGTYVVAYSLDTGAIVGKFISPFDTYLTRYDLFPDGKTLMISDPDVDMWEVTWDRSTGMVMDARAIAPLGPEEVQFSPDRHFLAIGGYGIKVYDLRDTSKPETRLRFYTYIPVGYDTWRFVDASTLEFAYFGVSQKRHYDLNTKSFR